MKVKRIVANVGVSDPAAARHLYQDVLGLEIRSFHRESSLELEES